MNFRVKKKLHLSMQLYETTIPAFRPCRRRRQKMSAARRAFMRVTTDSASGVGNEADPGVTDVFHRCPTLVRTRAVVSAAWPFIVFIGCPLGRVLFRAAPLSTTCFPSLTFAQNRLPGQLKAPLKTNFLPSAKWIKCFD